MSELKVAVITGISQNMMLAGGRNRGVRQTGVIAANSIMPLTRNPACLEQPKPAFSVAGHRNPPFFGILQYCNRVYWYDSALPEFHRPFRVS